LEIDENDLFPESLDYWHNRLLYTSLVSMKKEFFGYSKIQRRKFLFEKKKKHLLSK